MLWLGIEIVRGDSSSFDRLGSKLDDEKERPFKLHITIARIKAAEKAKVLIDKHLASWFEPVEFDVNELVIYESTVLPAGSVYAKIASFPLGAFGH